MGRIRFGARHLRLNCLGVKTSIVSLCPSTAFRAVQDDLGLEEVYVLGTNCADNSPTPEAAFHSPTWSH